VAAAATSCYAQCLQPGASAVVTKACTTYVALMATAEPTADHIHIRTVSNTLAELTSREWLCSIRLLGSSCCLTIEYLSVPCLLALSHCCLCIMFCMVGCNSICSLCKALIRCCMLCQQMSTASVRLLYDTITSHASVL
jgi:hypothetical protein